MEEYTYGSRQEIGSPYCQIVYADFNRKSYFPIGFHGGSRIEPSRAERSNRTVQSVWADAIKSTDAVELSKPKRDMRKYVYIYMQYIWDHPRNTRKINFSRRANGVDGPTPIDFHINVTFTKSLAVNRSALYIPLLSVFTFLVFHRELKVL